MADFLIRNIPETKMRRLRKQAKAKGQSLQQYLRDAVLGIVKLTGEEAYQRALLVSQSFKDAGTPPIQDIIDEVRAEIDTRWERSLTPTSRSRGTLGKVTRTPRASYSRRKAS